MLKRPGGALVLVLVVLVLSGCTSMTPAAKAPSPSIPVPQVTATIIDGVALNPITAGEWRECEQVADATHAPVPCPTLLPVPMPGSQTALSCAAMSGMVCGRPMITASGRYFLVNRYGFVVPAGYVGWLPGSGHFVVLSARHFDARADPALRSTPIPGYCAPVPQHPPLVVHSSVASMYECGQDPGPSGPIADQYMETVSGHELVEWSRDGVTCEVSFHGHSAVNRDLAVGVVAPRTWSSLRAPRHLQGDVSDSADKSESVAIRNVNGERENERSTHRALPIRWRADPPMMNARTTRA